VIVALLRVNPAGALSKSKATSWSSAATPLEIALSKMNHDKYGNTFTMVARLMLSHNKCHNIQLLHDLNWSQRKLIAYIINKGRQFSSNNIEPVDQTCDESKNLLYKLDIKLGNEFSRRLVSFL
jgi:hypothetical protein